MLSITNKLWPISVWSRFNNTHIIFSSFLYTYQTLFFSIHLFYPLLYTYFISVFFYISFYIFFYSLSLLYHITSICFRYFIYITLRTPCSCFIPRNSHRRLIFTKLQRKTWHSRVHSDWGVYGMTMFMRLLHTLPCPFQNATNALASLLVRHVHYVYTAVYTLLYTHYCIYTIVFTLLYVHYCIYTIVYTLLYIHYCIYTAVYTPLYIHYCIYTAVYTLLYIHYCIHTAVYTLLYSLFSNNWVNKFILHLKFDKT